MFWQSSREFAATGKVLCQNVAVNGTNWQFFIAAILPLPCSNIMAQNLFHKGFSSLLNRLFYAIIAVDKRGYQVNIFLISPQKCML